MSWRSAIECLFSTSFCHSSHRAMEDQISSRANRSYQTTYRREYVLKRSPSIAEGIPLSQQFPVSSPYRLEGPIGSSIYAVDYFKENKVQREEFPRPNTNRANRPHPHRDFPFWPRRAESLGDLSAEETEQALKNQLNSTYRADFAGSSSLHRSLDHIRFFQERHKDFHCLQLTNDHVHIGASGLCTRWTVNIGSPTRIFPKKFPIQMDDTAAVLEHQRMPLYLKHCLCGRNER